MVRLKDKIQRPVNQLVMRFNSKVVRLKVCPILTCLNRLFQFQFQSGAVKRRKVLQAVKPYTQFQFQSGAVKRTDKIRPTVSYSLFQFQSGAVKRNRFVHQQNNQNKVSIPKWCG